jgi:hypothetical protein
MADPIYGLHQNQPRDIYDFMRASGRKIDLPGSFSYLPLLKQKATRSEVIGLEDGLEFIISDEVLYFEQPLMDGRNRRYAKVRAYSVAFGSYTVEDSVAVLDEIKRLGYKEMTTLAELAVPSQIAALIGVSLAAYGTRTPVGAAYVEFLVGAPSYQGDSVFIEDAPNDGQVYNRVDGRWVVDPAANLSSIDGGFAS